MQFNASAQKPHVLTDAEIDTIAKYAYIVSNPWIFAATSEQNERWYVYETYVAKEYGQIKIWIKATFPTTTYQKKVYKNVVYKQLISCDCNDSRYRVISEILYSSKGSVIYNNKVDGDYEDLVPETVMEGVSEKICSTYNH